MIDVWLVAIFGVVGYLLRKADYPLAPLVLALVLGPLMEKAFRQTLIAEHGDLTAFVTRPISGSVHLHRRDPLPDAGRNQVPAEEADARSGGVRRRRRPRRSLKRKGARRCAGPLRRS